MSTCSNHVRITNPAILHAPLPPRTIYHHVESYSHAPAAVIYLKNRVNRGWQQSEANPTEPVIPEDAKARFRDRLLPILASSQPLIRHQLIPILQRILHFDFPDRWPTFLDFTVQLLNTNDPSSVLAGLQCLLAICRSYRYKASEGDDNSHFDKITAACFPRLLEVCNELVNQESNEAGEMLHIALKSYKHATWVCLPSPALLYSLHFPMSNEKLFSPLPNSSNFQASSVTALQTLLGARSSYRPCPRLPRLAPCQRIP